MAFYSLIPSFFSCVPRCVVRYSWRSGYHRCHHQRWFEGGLFISRGLQIKKIHMYLCSLTIFRLSRPYFSSLYRPLSLPLPHPLFQSKSTTIPMATPWWATSTPPLHSHPLPAPPPTVTATTRLYRCGQMESSIPWAIYSSPSNFFPLIYY